MIFKAHTIGSLIADNLRAETVDAAVHSSYDRAINIVGPGALWLSIHPLGVPLHPFAVTIDPGSYDWAGGRFLNVTPQERCLVSESVIAMEAANMRVDLDGARIWQSRLTPLTHMRENQLAMAFEALGKIVEESPVRSIFLGAVLGRDVDQDGHSGVWPPASRIARLTHRIADAWCRSDIQPCIEAVSETIGLGSGLTPSGDDFLTGLLASSFCFNGDDRFRIELFRHLSGIIAKTTLPSFYMLKAALGGHYPEPLVSLLWSLGWWPGSGLRKSLNALIGVGATSGEDMLAGVCLWHRIMAPCEVGHASC